MEAYIGKCLDSLLIPEFDQVEVLVVNDGSKDRSSEIAHSYADRYPDSIRVIDKPNGNYGSCINAALPQATGRYVKILDADDTFDTTAFSEFVRLLTEIEDDMVVTDYCIVDIQGNTIRKNTRVKEIPYNQSLDVDVLFIKRNKYFIPMHRIAYMKNVFSRFSYSQAEGISYSDSQWSVQPISYCRTVRLLSTNLYRYLLGREGQTSDPTVVARSISQYYKNLRHQIDSFKTNNPQGKARDLYIKGLVNLHRSAYLSTILQNNPDFMVLLREHDIYLCQELPEAYELLGRLKYERNVPFRFINRLRVSGYKAGFRLPLWARIWTSVVIRLGL